VNTVTNTESFFFSERRLNREMRVEMSDTLLSDNGGQFQQAGAEFETRFPGPTQMDGQRQVIVIVPQGHDGEILAGAPLSLTIST